MIHFDRQSGALTGAIIFAVPVLFFILWIYACNQASGYPENVDLYQSYLPSLLRGRSTTAMLSVVLCAIAVCLNARNLGNANRYRKIVSWFVTIAGVLLGFFNLFSMM